MSKKKVFFVVLLIGPSTILYALNYGESTPVADTISAALSLIAVTVCPLIGALYFKPKASMLLSLLIPIVFVLTKAINFGGAERLVAAAFLMSFCFSAFSCGLGLAIKYVYRRHFFKGI